MKEIVEEMEEVGGQEGASMMTAEPEESTKGVEGEMMPWDVDGFQVIGVREMTWMKKISFKLLVLLLLVVFRRFRALPVTLLVVGAGYLGSLAAVFAVFPTVHMLTGQLFG